IGEIIRGSIQAVSRGQHEAAESLGLRRGQQLRLVILPQALRIAIPAINSQYLNLMKNSSLALLVGFPELLSIGAGITNNLGHALPVLFLTMLTYLAISLTISFLMNLVNRAVTVRGAR
ncbi:MAG: ABC transporter permease subunit, partial [Actinomycetota bacterium]